MAEVRLIAAVAHSRVIGVDGKIPWDVPEDRRIFRDHTIGHRVIMGRKTFESLPAPLKDRDVYILSRTMDGTNLPARHYVVSDILDAIDIASAPHKDLAMQPIVYIAGGEEVYQAALPYADSIYITRIDKDIDPNGATRFPAFTPDSFEETFCGMGAYSRGAEGLYFYQQRYERRH